MFFFSISSVISIPIMLIGINGGYFPAICRVCLIIVFFDLFRLCPPPPPQLSGRIPDARAIFLRYDLLCRGTCSVTGAQTEKIRIFCKCFSDLLREINGNKLQ